MSANDPVIPTQFEIATLWESGYSKLEWKFIKTRIPLEAATCASFEYCHNTTSQLGFAPLGRGYCGGGLDDLTRVPERTNGGFAGTLRVSVYLHCQTMVRCAPLHAPYAAAQLRESSAGGWLRYSHSAGTIGTFRCEDNDDLHASAESSGAGGEKSGGCEGE